jgi:hypothetical protein
MGDRLAVMDAIKKEQAIPRPRVDLGAPQPGDEAVVWWANWAKDHSDQIAAYNKDVLEKGIWSDRLRAF